jgi:hypothetical protein
MMEIKILTFAVIVVIVGGVIFVNFIGAGGGKNE